MLSTVLGRFGCSREGILKPHGSFIYDKVQFFLYWTYVMTNWLNRVLDNIINVAGAPYLNEVAATDLDAGHQGDRSVSFASHKNSHFRLKILTVGQPMHHGRFGFKESYWKPFSRIRNQHPCSFNPHHLSLSKPCHIKVKGLSLPKLLSLEKWRQHGIDTSNIHPHHHQPPSALPLPPLFQM
ncbi:hypothetical protein Peur_053000 [Populus x canadensis]